MTVKLLSNCQPKGCFSASCTDLKPWDNLSRQAFDLFVALIPFVQNGSHEGGRDAKVCSCVQLLEICKCVDHNYILPYVYAC